MITKFVVTIEHDERLDANQIEEILEEHCNEMLECFGELAESIIKVTVEPL